MLIPIVIPVPTVAGLRVAGVWAYSALRVVAIGAYLRGLTTGPFTIEIREGGGSGELIKTFTFNAAGMQQSAANELDFLIEADFGIRVDVAALGAGAQNCLVTVWVLI
jgi:hypothetical protein